MEVGGSSPPALYDTVQHYKMRTCASQVLVNHAATVQAAHPSFLQSGAVCHHLLGFKAVLREGRKEDHAQDFQSRQHFRKHV